jgi:hypothetical protein
MKIENLKVYDLEESLIASGYPMRTTAEMREVEDKDWRRGLNLTKASNGNGAHGQWLTGVRVAFDLTCTNKMWVEAERYRFLEFVSSQSTMHRITKFDLRNQYERHTDPRIIAIMEEKLKQYNQLCEIEKTIDPSDTYRAELYKMLKREKYLELLYTNPAGFELTARLTTNYRCLLNIYIQRHDHRLPEWREFCEYMLNNLPYFRALVEAYYNGKVEVEE